MAVDGNGSKLAQYIWAGAFLAWAGVILAAWQDITAQLHELQITIMDRLVTLDSQHQTRIGLIEKGQAILGRDIENHIRAHELPKINVYPYKQEEQP